MADVIKKSTNKFTKGLVMDFSPENTRNEVLTHALNATLLTFNGNELSLQNDMGNARVETAYLPEGYIPVGTCEYGGIIYIVSYNPLEDKSQIGCFPSPERNVSNDELGSAKISPLTWKSFQDEINNTPSGTIHHNAEYILLKENSLNPGDKFLINANPDIYEELLLDLTKNGEPIANPVLALNIVSIEDSGKIIYLNSALRQYEKTVNENNQPVRYSYHILGEQAKAEGGLSNQDLDSYRNVMSSGYNVFRSKTSGRLAILAELVMIDSYSVTHSVKPSKDLEGNVVAGSFDVILHTEVTPALTVENFATSPKLAYYHLKESQGYLSYAPLESRNTGLVVQVPLFNYSDQTKQLNEDFLKVKLTEIYSPSTDINLNGSVSDSGKFRFPYSDTYHGKMLAYDPTIHIEEDVYTLITAGNYHRMNKTQVINNLDYFVSLDIEFYKHDPVEGQYIPVDKEEPLSEDKEYFVNDAIDCYEDAKRDTQYMGQTLYEKVNRAFPVASKDILDNTDIQKYKKETSFIYTPIEYSAIRPGMTIVIRDTNTPEKWVKVQQPTEDGGPYYQQITGEAYIPITQEEAYRLFESGIFYYPAAPQYKMVSQAILDSEYWPQDSDDLYPYDATSATWGYPKLLYRYWKEDNFVQATEEHLQNYYKPEADTLYYKTDYVKIDLSTYNGSHQLFMVPYRDTYLAPDKFIANSTDNYIKPGNRPPSDYSYHLDGLRYDAPMTLHVLSSFIPQLSQESGVITQYDDFKIGTLKLPNVSADNDLDLPFKYSYTVVPCMNYGKLDHLAISNTVDFSQLHAFNHSQFNTWKYHIDGSQLKLTFGAEIFDTFEDNKVDALVLEFYDLWGFAGSLEISDKKSYSGVFTKIIPLNSINALSKKFVRNNEYVDGYIHNVSIVQKENAYYLGEEEVTWDSQTGWSGVSVEDNDCGVLYSNLIYGVKTYLRQTTSEGFKFTRKKDLFLYTLPILNDFYYTVNDFSTIENPTVDVMLTYKLMDSSNKAVYNSDKVEKGYDTEDLTPVSNYLKGQYKESSLSGTKYYSYTGTSKLCLEIGLKQEYQQYGLSYSPEINDFFSCTLQLVSDDTPNRTFTVMSGDTASTNVLNYKETTGLTVDSNQITFGELGTGTESEITIQPGSFRRYNFINSSNISTIPIKYQWIVGYPFSVSDIRTSDVQATTVCALMHQNSSNQYNLSDFGLHLVYEGDYSFYLSDTMFMNSGTAWSEIFGIVSHQQTTGNASQQYTLVDAHSQNSIPSHESRVLNTGDAIKKMKTYIGKLTFCQPHAHIHPDDTSFGVNVYDTAGSVPRISGGNGGFVTKDYAINQYNDYDDCYGIVPVNHNHANLYSHPWYNLSVNTVKSLNEHYSFISTMDYATATGSILGYDINQHQTLTWSPAYTSRKFVGMTGSMLKDFYSKFTTTLKNIYAYNPDYDQLTLQMGQVNVSDNPVTFVSHLISKNASITFPEGKVFSDYLYLGSVSFSNYFLHIQTYSTNNLDAGIKTFEKKNNSSTPIPLLNFVPSYMYLGQSNGAYLVTSLTYNTYVPSELSAQLEIKTSNQTCIKHEDGSYDFIEGTPNQNLLYGYDKENRKLVQLDVSNYTIDVDGNLQLRRDINKEEFFISIPVTEANFKPLTDSSGFAIQQELVSSESGNSICAGTMYLDKSCCSYALDVVDVQNRTLYYLTPQGISTVFTDVIVNIDNDITGYNYSSELIPNTSWSSVKSYVLKINIATPAYLDKDTLHSIMYGNDSDEIKFTYTTSDGEELKYSGTIGSLRHEISGRINGTELLVGSDRKTEYPVLTAVQFTTIPLKMTRTLDYTLSASAIVHVPVTKTYSEVRDYRYVLTSKAYNQARFRGTSIVINDLLYHPFDEHRLFMRDAKYEEYSSKPYRAIIYYRSINDPGSWGAIYNKFSGATTSQDYSDRNHLFLHIGPCFTLDNLNEADYDN